MTTRRRSMGLGFLAAGAFSLAGLLPSAARGEGEKPPQYALEFKEQVRVATARAKEVKELCGDDAARVAYAQTRLLALLDRLLAQRPRSPKPPPATPSDDEKTWMGDVLKKLKSENLADAGASLPDGVTADGFAEWLAKRKTAVKEASSTEASDQSSFQSTVCKTLCAEPDAAANPPKYSMNVCLIASNDVLANASVALDSRRLSTAFAYEKKNADQIRLTVKMEPVPKGPGTRRKEDKGKDEDTKEKPRALPSLATGALLSGLTGAAGLDAATPFLSVAFEGLAKLIADRAKQEAIGWALDSAGGSLCGKDGAASIAQKDIAAFWMPGFCSLAARQRLHEYGAGAALLESLKSALVQDARGWPGAFGGLVMGSVFWEEAAPMKPAEPSIMNCVNLNYEECRRVEQIRHTTAERLTSLLDGASPLPKLAQLGADYDRINRYVDSNKNHALYSKATQIIGCGLSLPQEVERHHRLFQVSLSDPEQRAHAAALAALVKAEACFTMLGNGIKDSWRVLGGEEDPTRNTALQSPHGIERITTLIRLEKVSASILQLAASWKAVAQATLDYEAAVKKAAEELSKLRTDPPKLENLEIKDPEALKKYIDDFIHSTQVDAQRKHLMAALALAKASLGLGRSGIALIRTMDDPKLLPGLELGNGSLSQAKLQTVDAAWARVELQIDALSSVTKGDWSTLAAHVMASLRTQVTGIDITTWGDIEKKMAQRTALILAILNAKDGDEMARALDAVAAPPGGWRTKGLRGEKTFSIVAHPGFFVGGEVRRGPYGVVFETGHHLYPVAPALTMPVGVEFAWGSDSHHFSPCGVFISLLDPAAFLQYDASTDARLPGPSVKTALAPGVGLRLGVPETPFSLMPFFTYRPGFRQWEAAANGSGADVYQLGLAVTVDVTLFHTSFKKDD